MADTEKKVKITIDADEAKNDINNIKDGVSGLKDNLSLTSIASKGLGGTIKSLGSSFGALTKAAWGFVATPVGAFITTIALAATSLYSVFKNFTPVLDKIEQLFAGISAVASTLKNVFVGLITGTKSLKESFSGLGGAMKDAATEAMALKKAEQDLDDQLKINEIRNKEAEAQINKLLVQSKNRSLSEKERTKLIEEAMAIEQKQFEQTKANADEEYRIALQKLINGKNLTKQQIEDLKTRGVEAALQLQDLKLISDEEIDNLKNAQLKKIEIQNKSTQLVEKSQNRLDQLADKAAADEEKRRSDSAAKKQKDIEDTLKAAEDKNKKELILIKEQALAEGKSKEELDKLIEDKELEHIKNMIALRKSLGQETIDLENTYADKRIAINDRIAKEEAKLAEEKKKKEEEDAKKAEEKRKKDEEDAAAKKKKDEEDAEAKRLKDLADAEELQQKKIELAKQSVDTINQIDEQATNFRKNLLQNQLNSGKITQEQYDKKIAEIEKKAAQRKKAYAIAETIINTAAAIIGIWKDFPKVDFGATAAVMSVGMGILGAAQVATIASTPVDGSSTGSASGSGSMPSSSGTGGTAPTTSFSFAEAPKTPETQPARTYVVSKEVTTQQELDRQIISNGTL